MPSLSRPMKRPSGSRSQRMKRPSGGVKTDYAKKTCRFCGGYGDGKWNGWPGEDYAFCRSCYTKARRNDPLLPHPTWIRLKANLYNVDKAGDKVCLISGRCDVAGIQTLAALCRAHHYWSDPVYMLCLTGLGAQWYYPQTMQHFFETIEGETMDTLTVMRLRAIADQVNLWANQFRVFERAFVYGGTKGAIPNKNPSEKWPLYRYHKIVDDWHRWQHCCALWSQLRSRDLPHYAAAFEGSGLRCYNLHSWNYGAMRILRIISLAKGITYKDTPDAWFFWRSMSLSLSTKLKAIGLWDARSAFRFRDAIAAELGRSYTLNDLVCYVCLSVTN